MIIIHEVLVANGAGILILLFLLINSFHKQNMLLGSNKVFSLMILLNIVQCLLEPLTLLIDGKIFPLSIGISLVANSFLFFNNIVFSFTWIVYVLYKIFDNISRMKKYIILFSIPSALSIILIFINLFKPILFVVSPENVYQRSFLFPIMYFVTYINLVFGAAIVYRYKSFANKYLFMPAIMFLMPVVVASVIQFLFYGMSLVWLGAAIGIGSLYINIQNETSYTDDLSGLYTRHYLNQYLEAKIAKNHQNYALGGIMIDIDGFKSINDTYGHIVGDDAIKCVGKMLREKFSKSCFVSRYAGDEFIVIIPTANKDILEDMTKTIYLTAEEKNNENNKQYTISFSCGSAMFEKDDTLDTFYEKMDKEMYRMKNQKKMNR